MSGSPTPESLALDLGSTRIKAARLGPGGTLTPAGERPAPPLSGTGEIREGDAEAYIAAAIDLFRSATRPGVSPEAPWGIACQRSSFVLWEAATGRPVTPLVAWQDRRAEAWCRAHAAIEPEVARRTGLVLSPHYAGPKLAALLADDPDLRGGLAGGRLRFGTLETFLLWRLTDGAVHHTDHSMAARTLLLDLETGDWSRDLLKTFGIPRAGLPTVGDTAGLALRLPDGGAVTATVADQAAAALAVLGDGPGADPGHALVNLGTGGFVLRIVARRTDAPPGYLCGPLCRDVRGTRWAAEGTINGIGPAVGSGTTPIPDADPTPDALCIPDTAGIGAPHWRADLGPVENAAFARLSPADRRRGVLEGIVFRICAIVDDLARAAPVTGLVVAGGLAAEPFIAPALAACAGLPSYRLREPEATLLGAASLAAGMAPPPPGLDPVAPRGEYLPEKFGRWKRWRDRALDANGI
jgi:glycerol kinase